MPSLARSFRRNSDVALDVGTAVTRMSTSVRRARLETPSVFGERAALQSGAVLDREATIELLRPLFWRTRTWGTSRPRALACAPTDATDEERETLKDCVTAAGASAVRLVPEPLAAAVGAGVDVGGDYAQCIVDFGEGITDCAIIRSGSVAASHAVRVGCGDLRRAVCRHASTRGLALSETEAEELVRLTGISMIDPSVASNSAHLPDPRFTPAEVASAIEPHIVRIVDAVLALLGDIPARMHLEVIESGVILAGGGALLPGMRERIERATSLTTFVACDPMRAVIIGAQAMLETAEQIGFWKD
ncbi:MAG: rod shape-determining protein [Chthoniobacteraceae bacterium]